GLHVTQGQIDRRENLLQNQYGLAAVYNFGSNQLGLLNYSSLWGRSLETLGSRHLHMSSIYHKFQTGAWKLSGEYAFDYQGKYAIQSGLLYTPGKIKIGIGYRYFSPQLFGDMSSTIRHYSGRLKNEKGINLGLAFTLPAEIKFTGYIDFFSRVAPPNNGSPPPLGKESLVQLYKNFNSSYKIWLKYKQMYEIFHSDANFCSLKKQFKLKSHLEITHYLDLITRFIYNNLQTGNNEQNGLAISNSLEIDLNPINIIFGSSNFYTDSYESRVYLYEPGIPLRFNLPVLYGTGRRYFFTINYRINEIFLLYFVCSYAEQRKINQNKWNRKKLFELQLEINL
ncbi:MAG: hypothetical protein K9M80_08020, partial [Candidatus Marinimicrobia bacterium]|nr:hypothetical protein [Candidatus Neomarinimicrobiota bacterium]